MDSTLSAHTGRRCPMAVKAGNKRKAQTDQVRGFVCVYRGNCRVHAQGASKKRKLSKDTVDPKKPSAKPKGKGKEKAADRATIPIPTHDDDVDLSDEDLEAFEEFGDAIGFLSKLDEKGIARCVIFTLRKGLYSNTARQEQKRDRAPTSPQ